MDASDGACQVVVEYQDEKLRLEGRRLLPPGESLEKGKRLEQAVGELTDGWFSKVGADLDVASRPSGAQILLDGKVVGLAPLALHHLRPGMVHLEARGAGWTPGRDSLVLEIGAKVHRELALVPSAALRDSLKRDSLLSFAKTHPGQALPDLFAHLLSVELPAGRHTVAILPFQTESDKKGSGSWDPGTMAAEYGVQALSRDPRFVVVDRAGLNQVLREQALVQSGAVGDSVVVRAGKLLAAQYVVVGTVRVQGPKQDFSARMVSVETGEVVSAALASAASEQLESLYRTALGERAGIAGTLYRSAVGPGWGQFYTDHPVQGTLALGAFLGAAAWTGWSWADYNSKDGTLRKYRQNDPSTVKPGQTAAQWVADAEAARTARNDALSRLGLSWAVLGGVWGLNLLDAGILGALDAGSIRARYFAWTPTSVEARPDGMQLAWRF